MRPKNKHSGVAGWAVLLTLMVAGTAGAADDVGLVDAARNQDPPKVRALNYCCARVRTPTSPTISG